MPPVGAAPDTQPAPQGPPPPISVGSKASEIAAAAWHGSNEKPAHVPGATDQLAPAEEQLPADVMPPAPGEVRVPVAPVAATPVDATTAFVPQAAETPPPMQAATPPSSMAPPAYPTPDWEAMAGSTKAGAEPSTPGTESPATAAFGELDQSNLDRDAAVSPEMKAFYDYVAQDPQASLKMLELANDEPDPAKRQKKLGAVIPVVRQVLDDLEKNMYPR